jgi:steroid delta-isomerase-like uncharacterized protein
VNSTYMKVLRAHVAAENAHRLDDTLATLHPDCIFEDLGQGRVYRRHDGAARHYREWWDGLDVTVVGERTSWTDDGHLLAEARFKGTHVGEFLGVASTGRSIALPFVVVVGFRDNLMFSERFYYNPAALLSQLDANLLAATVLASP